MARWWPKRSRNRSRAGVSGEPGGAGIPAFVLPARGRAGEAAHRGWLPHDSIFFIGRNLDYALGLEGSLKLKEISYIHSEAYASGELKHGTISLIEPGTLVVALGTYGPLFEKAMERRLKRADERRFRQQRAELPDRREIRRIMRGSDRVEGFHFGEHVVRKVLHAGDALCMDHLEAHTGELCETAETAA